MRVESLAKILGGDIENSPNITYIEQLRLKPSHIKRADAFLHSRNSDIKNIDIAIKNGAYAIITDEKPKIIDEEIAWIVVDDIKKAIIRYLRYKNIQDSLSVYYIDDISFNIAKTISKDKTVIFLGNDLCENFYTIINADRDSIFLCSNKDFVTHTNPFYQLIDENKKQYMKVIKHTIFSMDIVFEETFYKNIKIPPLFLENLNKIISFFTKNSLLFSLENAHINNHFKPIFIDNRLNIKNFGETSKILIVEKDVDLLKSEIEYLRKNAKYAKSALLLPENFERSFDIIDIFFYNDYLDLEDIIKNNHHFFLLLCKKGENIITYLNKLNKKRENRLL